MWLAYRFQSGLIQDGIKTLQWIDGKENPDWVHVGLKGMAPDQVMRQNPGGPAFEPTNLQPWDHIDVFRVDLSSIDVPAELPRFPDEDPKWLAMLDVVRQEHWADAYAYVDGLGIYTVEDWLARMGLGSLTEEMREHINIQINHHREVCSEWGRDVITETTQRTYDLPGFNLFPHLGDGQCRPADTLLTPYLSRA